MRVSISGKKFKKYIQQAGENLRKDDQAILKLSTTKHEIAKELETENEEVIKEFTLKKIKQELQVADKKLIDLKNQRNHYKIVRAKQIITSIGSVFLPIIGGAFGTLGISLLTSGNIDNGIVGLISGLAFTGAGGIFHVTSNLQHEERDKEDEERSKLNQELYEVESEKDCLERQIDILQKED